MNKINHLMVLIVFFCLFLISACGGGSSTPTLQTPSPEPTTPKPEPTTPLPSSFNLTTLETSTPKTLTFSWNKSTNANNYTLCQVDASKPNNCQILVDNILGQTTDYTFAKVIDPSITDTNFFILANNATGATPSNETSPELSDYIGMIDYLKASNIGDNDRFGWSVSLSNDGNTLAVGSFFEDGDDGGTENDSGAVYVFTRNPDNSWSEPAYLKAINIGANDRFGYSVSLSGDGNTLAVGAFFEDGIDNGTENDSGAVYVFIRDGSSWVQTHYLKASNIGADDRFGYSISLSNDGNTLAVGAYKEDSTQINSGAVYVFSRDGSGWTQTFLKASVPVSVDQFGISVSLSSDGNTLAVGAVSNSGAVYVFTRDTGNSWSQQAYLEASNIGAGDNFGQSISLSNDGNTLAVGAYLEDGDGSDGSGAVYVFSRDGSSWDETDYLKASNIGEGFQFGISVSLSNDGNSLAIGARYEGSGSHTNQDDNTGKDSGSAYLLTRNPDNSWSEQAYLKASTIGNEDQFGNSVSLSGDGNTLAVGAYKEDSNSQTNPDDNSSLESGAVYIY